MKHDWIYLFILLLFNYDYALSCVLCSSTLLKTVHASAPLRKINIHTFLFAGRAVLVYI
jgi:hypothetical protein